MDGGGRRDEGEVRRYEGGGRSYEVGGRREEGRGRREEGGPLSSLSLSHVPHNRHTHTIDTHTQ